MVDELRNSATDADFSTEFLAVVSPTPHRDVASIVAGRIDGDRRYATWRPRGTGDYLILATVSGAGRIGFSGGELLVGAGDLAILRPGARHDYGTANGAANGRWEILWAHFVPRPHWLSLLAWPEEAAGVSCLRREFQGEHAPTIARCFSVMVERANGSLSRRDDFALNALEETLLWCATIVGAGDATDPRVEAAMAFFRGNLSRPIGVGDAARAVGLSESRLAHLFKARTGVAPARFLENERLSRARDLLRLTDRSVQSVAEEVGFTSAVHFSGRFKERVGVSPRAFRRRETQK